MNIVMIHGQNHTGCSCMVARKTAEKIGGEVQEFFLPNDFNHHCLGCYTCFTSALEKCPHYKDLSGIIEAIDHADVLILSSPVYVYHVTGAMKDLLDHFGTWWVVHRPHPQMCCKQAVIVTTAAGGGMKSTAKDIEDSLAMWGVHRIEKLCFGVLATKLDEIPAFIMKRIESKTTQVAKKVRRNHGTVGANMRFVMWFYIVKLMHRLMPSDTPDYRWWENHGWHGRKRPWDWKRVNG